jgi:hypothetical protein
MEDLTIDSAIEQADEYAKRINDTVMPPFDDPDEDDDSEDE